MAGWCPLCLKRCDAPVEGWAMVSPILFGLAVLLVSWIWF